MSSIKFPMSSKHDRLLSITRHPGTFIETLNGIHLYQYQMEPFMAIWNSITHQLGLTFVIIFSRQAGKDEMIANLIVFLLSRFHDRDATIVCAQPTFKPQTITAMERLQARLARPWYQKQWKRTGGYIYKLGRARCTYFSAEPTANVVGATARTLLVINEAQDVDPAIYDKNFAPMAATGNATKLFSGTSWTITTLLARELRLAQAAQKADGIRRVFISDGNEVSKYNPFYAVHLAGQLERFGRDHPLIRTQYFCEEIDAQAGMFTPARLLLMVADQPPQQAPAAGKAYAFLLDVAGQDESRMSVGAGLVPAQNIDLTNPGRDSISLSIVEIDPSSLPILQLPTYRVVNRQSWTGQNHVAMFGVLRNLAQTWKPQHIVIDATGVGEGLWAMLDHSFPDKVLPVKFTQAEKSEIGWRFISIIETGRFRDCVPSAEAEAQYRNCQAEILPGPTRTLRWGIPDGTRGADGELLHDDIVVSDSLVSVLDRLEWQVYSPTLIVPGRDPLQDLKRL